MVSGSIEYNIPWDKHGSITAYSYYLYADGQWYAGKYGSTEIRSYVDGTEATKNCIELCEEHGETYTNFWMEEEELICNCSEE